MHTECGYINIKVLLNREKKTCLNSDILTL